LDQVRLGRLTLQPGRQLLADGVRVEIGRRALDVLSALVVAKGNLVTKDELIAAVWPGAAIEENAIQAQIVALRKALGPDAAMLKTIRGIGYQFEFPEVPVDRGPPSLIVLPFADMSEEGEQDYFADGICEDIITDLSKVSGLRVIARNTAFSFKGQSPDIAEIAQRFGVSHVLEGSVRKARNRIRITAQLIDASSGLHVWADRYDRDLVDIFALQDEVAHAIVTALEVTLLPSEKEAIADRGTDNFEAYDLVLRARSLIGQMGLENTERALALSTQAVELDPRFMLAYHQLAACFDFLEFHAPERKAECDRRRQSLIEQATAVAPDDPLFLLLRCRDHVRKGELVVADELNQRVPEGTDLGMFWGCPEFFDFYVARFGPVLDMFRSRMQSDPLDRRSSLGFHDLLDISRLFDEADAEAQRNRDLPGDRSHFAFSTFLRAKGRATPQELSALFRLVLDGEFNASIPALKRIEPVLHVPEAAKALIREGLADPTCQDPLRQLWLARMAAYYDDTDVVLAVFRHVFVESDTVIDLRCVMWQSPFRAAHRDPRFKDILEALGLSAYWRQTGRWGDYTRPLGNGDFEVIE